MTLESVQAILLKDERTPWINVHSAYDEMPLTVEAFRLLCHISRRSDNKDGLCQTSYRKMGEVCFKASYPKSSSDALTKRAMRASAELKGYGLLRVEPKFVEGVGQVSNVFILTHTSEWNLGYTPDKNTNVRGVDRSKKEGGDTDGIPLPPPTDVMGGIPQVGGASDTGGTHKVIPQEGIPEEGKNPLNPPQAGETIAPQSPKVQEVVNTCLSSEKESEAKTPNSDPETKRRRAAAPKKPSPGDRFAQDGLTDKGRQSRVIALRKDCFSSEADVIAALSDKSLGERIQRTWAWYKTHCSDLPEAAAIGDQTSAAIALVILWESDFLGYGVDGFRKGCLLFAERVSTKKGSGVPACSRFLVGKCGEQPYWVQELVKAEPTAKVSDPAGEAVQRSPVDQEEVSRRLVEEARASLDREFRNQQGAA